MPRRTTSSHHKHAAGDDIQVASASSTTVVASPEPAPSLESLLKSCGALKSAIRQNDSGIPQMEIDVDPDSSVKSDEQQFCPLGSEGWKSTEVELNTARSLFDSNGEGLHLGAVDPPTSGNEDPADIVSLFDVLRHEFCTSIDELKSAQTAAAAGQSAVLKALFEVISRSTSMQSGSSDDVEQKLADFEERVVNRIGQMCDFGSVAEPNAKLHSSNSKPIIPRSTNTNTDRSWAEIRDDFLLNGNDSETQQKPDDSESACLENVQSAAALSPTEQTCILEVPQAVDPETLCDVELRKVFLEREAFISTLISRLRQSYQQSSGHLPADKLKSMAEHLPEDLASKVLQTLQQLDEIARIGELELSLERARLSRQLSQLNHSRQLIDHHARQLGLTLTDDGTVSIPPKSANRGTGSRRWLNKLGFGQ
ncbi:MAG: hypothetical protein O2856_14165 [Planctomycetota bacterium]|nr:hypothetical protein [Planctomycetota bacterium]